MTVCGTEGIVLSSQEPDFWSYPESDKFSLCLPILFLQALF